MPDRGGGRIDTELKSLGFNRFRLGRQRRQAVSECVLRRLNGLEQAELIGQERMELWASDAVETVMAAVCRSWRIPEARPQPGSDSPSAWDGAGHRQWMEAIGILSGEIDGLRLFVPTETSQFCSGPPDARRRQRRRAVQAKLLQVQTAAGWQGKWRSLRRRMMMRNAWRGGTGLDPQAGWAVCGRSLGRIADLLAADPSAGWLPGLLRRPISGPPPRRRAGGPSGRLVLVEYLFPGKAEIAEIVAGVIPEEARLRLSIQFHACARARMLPSETGFCIYDQQEHSWHWHETDPSLAAAREAEREAQILWGESVMTGRPPMAVAEPPVPEEGRPDTPVGGELADAWTAGIAVAAAKRNEESARARLEAVLKGRMANSGRRMQATGLAGICTATVERTASEEDVRNLGLNPDGFRKPGRKLSEDRLLEEIGRIRDMIPGEGTGAEIYRRLNDLLEKPPADVGPIDVKRVLDELGDRAIDLPSVSMRVETEDAGRRDELQRRISAELGILLAGITDELLGEGSDRAGGEPDSGAESQAGAAGSAGADPPPETA